MKMESDRKLGTIQTSRNEFDIEAAGNLYINPRTPMNFLSDQYPICGMAPITSGSFLK